MNSIIVRTLLAKISQLVAYHVPRDAIQKQVTRREDGGRLTYLQGRLNYQGGSLRVHVHGASHDVVGKTVVGRASVYEKVQDGVTYRYVDLQVVERTEPPTYRMTALDGALAQWKREGWEVFPIPQRSRGSKPGEACLIFAPVDAKLLPNEVPRAPTVPRRAVRIGTAPTRVLPPVSPAPLVVITKQEYVRGGSMREQLERLLPQIVVS